MDSYRYTNKKAITPIAVFTYNRPKHTARALDALARCYRLDECDVIIYCDGPKTVGQRDEVEASREVVRRWAAKQHGTKVVERDTNLGLARSIVTGVTELCDQYGRVIVLEDDLVVSPDFLDYMLQALDRYKDSENVYQVSGYMFPVEHPEDSDAFFLPITASWGWATWARAWKIFSWEPIGVKEALRNSDVRRCFDLDGSYSYSDMLEKQMMGKVDSWGILWRWAVFKRDGLVLYPPVSLVWQGGFDGSGTHCGDESYYNSDDVSVFSEPILAKQIMMPSVFVADMASLQLIADFHRSISGVSSKMTFMSRLRKKLADRFD